MPLRTPSAAIAYLARDGERLAAARDVDAVDLDVRAAVAHVAHLDAAAQCPGAQLLEPPLQHLLGLELRQRQHGAGPGERHRAEHAALARDASVEDLDRAGTHLGLDAREGERAHPRRVDADRARPRRP